MVIGVIGVSRSTSCALIDTMAHSTASSIVPMVRKRVCESVRVCESEGIPMAETEIRTHGEGRAHGGVLLQHLLATVEDDVEVGGDRRLDGVLGEPTLEHWELLLTTCRIA